MVRDDLDSAGSLASVVGTGTKLYLTTGLGGGGMVSPDTVTIAETGIGNLMKHIGMVEGEIVPPRAQGRSDTRLMQLAGADGLVLAGDAGIYEPFVEIGDAVEASQPLDQVHDAEDPDRRPRQLMAWRGRRASGPARARARRTRRLRRHDRRSTCFITGKPLHDPEKPGEIPIEAKKQKMR
ncbi:MAG: hypothetical protein EXQ92_03775 [Alphaproteobacteria bacterium]|nr:hypothetical protein [Alphaproteobacteria bacterium]